MAKEKNNIVGAEPRVRPNSKGITLMSLVITVIIMLILVGVTVTVSRNENLFNKVSDGKTEAEISQEKAKIVTALNLIDDFNEAELQKKLNTVIGENKTTVTEFDEEYLLITFTENSRMYKLNKKGDIEQYELYIDTTPGTLATKISQDENGNDVTVYTIECIEDLVGFSKNPSAYSGKTVVLERTIDFKSKYSYTNPESIEYGDLNGDGTTEGILVELTKTDDGCIGFTPISNFTGTFDGQGNLIKNVYINCTKGAALFKYGKSIKNLSISGNITSSSRFAAGINVDGNPVIKNCINYANITGSNIVGGIFAGGTSSSGTQIINCVNYGTVTIGTSSYAYAGAGGICGLINDYTVKNCINEGEIKGNYPTGGIVGAALEENYIINSINKGISKGGIIGYVRSGTANIINCANLGICNGGIVNLFSGGNWNNNLQLNIKNCFNLGKTTNGIVGEQGTTCLTSTLNIENCYNAGESEKAILGKITTSTKTTTVTNIINTYYDTTKSTNVGAISTGITGINTIKDNATFLNTLNSNIGQNADWNEWVADKDGYPRSTTIE